MFMALNPCVMLHTSLGLAITKLFPLYSASLPNSSSTLENVSGLASSLRRVSLLNLKDEDLVNISTSASPAISLPINIAAR